MTQSTEQEKALNVLQALQALKDNGPVYVVCGICTNIEHALEDEDGEGELVEYWEESRDIPFENWDDPAASGDHVFPILGNYRVGEELMWQEGEYAAARWRLVDHLIGHYTALAGE